jgi:predicted ferric reductase
MGGERVRLGLKERVLGGARRLLGVFLYLWVVLTLFAVHESVVLAKRQIDYRGYGLAFINAWVLAKVMLLAEDLNIGAKWFGDRPLIYRVLSRAGLFAVVFMGAHTVEGVIVGLWNGKTIIESLPRFGSGSAVDILSVAVVLSVALTPFFAFRAIDQALGPGRLRSLLLTRGAAVQTDDATSGRPS